MISINNLHKAFGKNKVLQGIDLSFEGAGITAILGPNGSGKTTLIKCILGMVYPDKGDIQLGGQSIRHEWAYRDQLDYLPQIARFPENLTVLELFSLVKDLRKRTASGEELVELFGLKPFLNKRLSNLSGGTRQKVNIVQAMMFDSPLVIMDEPTAGLDPVAMIRLKEIIRREKERGKTILITTHLMNFVEEVADDVVFILEGKIHFKGSLSALKAQYGEAQLEQAIAHILEGKKPENTVKV